MSTPIVRYKYIEEVEVLEDYRPGGYHPVQINDTLRHDRYQIVHKPGHGTFSTAWLALDRNSSTYVVVKVGAAYADKDEVDILSRLAMTDVARSLAVQVIKAVAHVHLRVYAHGDLHLGNLLLRLPASLNNLSIDQLYAKFGAPKLKPIARLDGSVEPLPTGVPYYAVLLV
ncbi:hypothetical protein QWA68_010443 [Fusarium oxysporum]|nr:hypothetical protein QWA68_010443 [Fusarium oxysporum]